MRRAQLQEEGTKAGKGLKARGKSERRVGLTKPNHLNLALPPDPHAMAYDDQLATDHDSIYKSNVKNLAATEIA